jgi:hypothetical protein
VDYTTINPVISDDIDYIDDSKLSDELSIIVSSYDLNNLETYSFEFEDEWWIGSFYFNNEVDDKMFSKLYDIMYSTFTDYTIEEWRYALAATSPVLNYDNRWRKSPDFEYRVYINGELLYKRYQEMRKNAKLVYEERYENLVSEMSFRKVDNIDVNSFIEDILESNSNMKSVNIEKTFCVDVENNGMIIRTKYKKEPTDEEYENIKKSIEDDLLNRPLYRQEGENRVGRPSKVYLFVEHGKTYFVQSTFDDESKNWTDVVKETIDIYDPLLYRILIGSPIEK